MLSVSERKPSSSTVAAREVDPLLRDLSEKKQSFRQNVVSLVTELKEVRGRLASQEKSFSTKIITRQEAETKAKMMQEEIVCLQKNLEERTEQLQASTSAAEMYVNELDDLKRQFAATKATAENSALSAQSAKSQCSALAEVIKEKTHSLHDHEICVSKLEEQLDRLQRDLQARDFSHMQLKDDVMRIEHEMMQAIGNAGSNKDHELRKMLDEVTPRNLDNINQVMTVKDQEIAILRDEIRIMSAHWRLKTKEMESQLEKHHRSDKELKTKVLKLEFCFHEARAQIRKLQRMGERRDKAIKELRDELAAKQQQGAPLSRDNMNFWETSQFKIVISMSMLVLVMFSKR